MASRVGWVCPGSVSADVSILVAARQITHGASQTFLAVVEIVVDHRLVISGEPIAVVEP